LSVLSDDFGNMNMMEMSANPLPIGEEKKEEEENADNEDDDGV